MVEITRADVHAALAEPHRLAIIDALALEDLSPGELGERTGQTSNLLAHHLGALAQAGVIHRRRSDADGRRSYLTLNWDNPVVAATALAGPAPTGSRVVFVCSANSARSQFAASLLAGHSVGEVASAGTEPASAIHPLALAELHARGLEPIAPRPTSALEVLRPHDVVVAVCDNAFEGLGRDRVDLHWSIPDPAAGDADDFRHAFDNLTPRVGRLAEALSKG
ncbi:helix-turn-helix domain-containing protein [Demequina sp. TTPB684]|uniref:arsenate reductase/protein-tyrosine-phosphatase family protein n=1 Tax=unclassified Demequina TaxID=2620311 RepID=UPI001CF20B57|nr:helix-turn-helix domain-containing protein [Demequina sp. TMPB413]MCB2412320.1 helix-turn-helix domain-containing protein [Demequina sp. TTPB684]UPU89485.1 helix-turn-helix domain-containing protein [Demequina sp. TMPB413]